MLKKYTLRSLAVSMLALGISAVSVLPAQAQSLLRDTEIEETLEEFTVPILRASGLSPQSVDIYLVNDPSLNAFVTRGQNIFLHSGLILEADIPNELKGVIAHEAGHIVGGHIVRSDYGNRSAYGSMLIAAGLGLAAILAGETSAGALILGGSTQFGSLEALSYSRVNESAADQYAVNFLDRTGQSSEGLIAFFEKFRAQEVLSQARRYPYFRSHPLSSNRIDALRERTAESPYVDVKDSTEELHKHEMMKAKLRGFLEGPQLVFSRYPLSDQSQYARYARSVAHYRAADLRNAIKELDSLIDEEPNNPYFHELKAQILYESGQRESAIPPARKALELKPDAPLLKMALAQSLIETQDAGLVEEAVTLVKSALQTEPDNSFAWYILSTAYGHQGKEALAKYASAERFYALGDIQRARSFAQRAQEDLPRNEPQWRRASDIVVVADAQLAKSKNKRRSPKPFSVTASQSSDW
ncbi:putative Zn-dependent protease [Litorimonas taeanensis]|uniref:Putative Zn-dependent protease n=1 Tax=Litorimonas taeanensis TaxID=568099 RepID=A0A420WJR6_9PROT|nr:M48 family metalloprotease [Litorimonas taeanensis]RKQ71260.1 putative Zn-dependent protease [Litorimonas taeanensis]